MTGHAIVIGTVITIGTAIADHRRTQWTDQQAEAMVARAYRSLLGREPDPASRSWVNQVKSNNWTEQQLMDEIKKSPEYIAKHPRERG